MSLVIEIKNRGALVAIATVENITEDSGTHADYRLETRLIPRRLPPSLPSEWATREAFVRRFERSRGLFTLLGECLLAAGYLDKEGGGHV